MLRIQKTPTHMDVKNLNGDIVAAKGFAWLNVTSKHDDRVKQDVGAFIVPKMLNHIPAKKLDISSWKHLNGIQLADETFHIPAKVDLLLGAAFYGDVIVNGIRKKKNSPTAQRTTFGWIVFGGYDESLQHASLVNTIQVDVSNEDLLSMLSKFWQQDQIPIKRYRTQEEQLCEDIFTKSITTNHEGRYIARMPLQPNAPPVIGSYEIAYARLMQMERKFARNPELKEKYVKFMQDYETLNHMSRVPTQEMNSDKAIYIPHHSAGTEKFRTVVDGSAKAKNGVSINDIQLNGEKIQPELTTTLMRFRTHRVALTADVAKMYRQILIAEDQRDLQRILWRESPDQPVREYRLNTQTYGNKSAAYVSIRTMQYMADEFATEYPTASKAVKTSFYVDDSLGGSHSARAAIHLHKELNEMFGRRKLELAKWNTNDPTVRAHIKSSGCSMIELNKEETTAVLGMHWDSHEDTFQYIIKNPVRTENATKRSVSSDIARLYDPCGYLSCVVIFAKVILKDLWVDQVDWDDKVTNDMLERWQSFAKKLPSITDIRIPRWINTDPTSTKHLHAFADASQSGYGVPFYLRQERKNEPITSHLVFAKARVAPVKGSTIPKLELTACHLAAQLLEEVRLAHDVDKDKCTMWTDSMIALHWIAKSPAKLDVFVGNRVGEIQELTTNVEWRHVDTKSNPADLASRGISPSELKGSSLWWNGPPWLTLDKEKWPKSKMVLTEEDLKTVRCHERKATAIVNATVAIDSPISNDRGSLINQHSNWQKLLRITAYVLRFINVTRKRATRGDIQLHDDEIINAECVWLRHSQAIYFAKEIESLASKQSIPEKSPLRKLAPFVDKDGLLRAAGRIKRSNMPYDTVHPIIINGKSIAAGLLSTKAHRATLHGGTQLTQQYLRQRYWIIGGRNAVKAVTLKCIPCSRQRKETQHQLMAHLPEERVTPGRPFESTALDYAGPVYIKRFNAARTKIINKGYIAVFVCTRTKATHLELVSSQTTEAFIAAFTRFSCRRGKIKVLVADNSTTFQGAENDQKQIYSTWRKLGSENDTTTKWKFIPPYAPHMGGLHEAAVKSAKAHLKRVIGAQQLTSEQFATLLTQVEACLNSRPLTPLTDDATDQLALTPGHFLIGEPIISPLTRDYTKTSYNRLKNFELMTKMTRDFWERWHSEYITTLMERGKWQHSQRNIKVGDIVLIAEDNVPPTQWALGKVEEAIKGDDGRVRVADVRSRGKIKRRPIVKLCLLPIDTDESSCPDGGACSEYRTE